MFCQRASTRPVPHEIIERLSLGLRSSIRSIAQSTFRVGKVFNLFTGHMCSHRNSRARDYRLLPIVGVPVVDDSHDLLSLVILEN